MCQERQNNNEYIGDTDGFTVSGDKQSVHRTLTLQQVCGSLVHAHNTTVYSDDALQSSLIAPQQAEAEERADAPVTAYVATLPQQL